MAYEYESKETRVLRTIDSQRYPDTNKDFTKNIRRLNSSVDYMSSYIRVMQKGIDDANKNFIEQIQSFINDLVVLFAGGEPTGLEIGDLKYIFQAIGALFGFGTEPFPINLFNAARNFFENFLSQLIQFTDVIFDAIEAWMLELIDKLGDVPIIGDTITRIANKIIDVTNAAQQGIDDAANAYSRGSLGVAKADTAIDLALDTVTSGSNIIKNASFENLWFQQLGSSFSTEQCRSGSRSLKITGAGWTPVTYYLISDDDITPRFLKVTPGDTFYVEAWVTGHTSNNQNSGGVNGIRFVFEAFDGLTALTPMWLGQNATTAINGSWTKMSGFVQMPANAKQLRVSLQLTTAVNSGQTYYFDDIVMREATLSAETNVKLFGIPGAASATTILDAAVPGLDATKVTSGQFSGTRIADAAVTNAKLGADISGDKIVAGTVGAARVASLDASKITTGTLTTSVVPNITRAMSTDLQSTINNVYTSWYGTAGSGSATDVSTTIAAIKTKLTSGFTLETITANGTWTRPWTPGTVDEPREFWAVCIGSGGGGGVGTKVVSNSGSTSGLCGAAGSYAAALIDPSTITSTVTCTIGPGGAGAVLGGSSAVGAAETAFGSLLTSIAGRAFISSQFGYYTADDSQPGIGGGYISGTYYPAGSTPLATAGAHGTSAVLGVSVVGPGGNGGTASLTGVNRAGGGGGGAGGTAATRSDNASWGSGTRGGRGGNGGYPGGGGGGGGGANDGRNLGITQGDGGNGANGVIVLLWR